MEANLILNKRERVAIVIPIYKIEPNTEEKKSLEQCLKILGSRSIIFVCTHKFDYSYYKSLCDKYAVPFERRVFGTKYFKSKINYNKLCLSKKLYQAFSAYEFILIYQLDAWIFFDDLDYWCNESFDFVGAPFPTDLYANDENVTFTLVGNGGFSLRRISSILNVLNHKYHRIKKWTQIRKAYHENINRNPLWILYCILRAFGYKNTINYLRKNNWEDHFFFDIARLTTFIRIPDPIHALRFSFEYRPSIAFSKNGNKLPMGCHGWSWIEYKEFWYQFIN